MNKVFDKESNFAWYLVKTFPGKESYAVDFIKNIAANENCLCDIDDFFVPKFVDKAKSKETGASVMMGYFAMHLNLTPQMLKVVDKAQLAKIHLTAKKYDNNGKIVKSKSTINHKITFFINKKMTKSDLDKMMDSSRLYNEIKNVYHVGEKVIIMDGPLKNLCGVIKKIYGNEKLCIDVEIVGRKVSIELDVLKIKKED